MLYFFLMLSLLCKDESKTYSEQYQKCFDAGIAFYRDHRHDFELGKKQNSIHLSAIHMYAIVAPEVGEYSTFRNFLEVKATEYFYIKLGQRYGNFSIGHFQMKPSFAEKIELLSDSVSRVTATENPLKYVVNKEIDIRKERIRRLNDYGWQLRYLMNFIRVAELVYKEVLKEKNEIEKLVFLATVYNAGIGLSNAQYRRLQKTPSFPARKILSPQFPYATISQEYSKHIHHEQ